jgi:vacuolar-type H+-ATPase subunit I/STV1
LQALFEQAPLAMDLMALLGLLTACYGFFCGLAQTDVRSALIFSTTAQVGLMFFSAGLGFWRLALCQLCAHAVFRGYQFLAAPALMHGIIGIPQRPVDPRLGRRRFFQVAALQGPWLENLGDRLAVKPVQELASDLNYFDGEVVEPVFGLPAPMASLASSLTKAETKRLEENIFVDPDILRVSGLPGLLVRNCANALFWFEERLVLQGVGQNMIVWGRSLGVRLNHIEDLLNQPRYLTVFILATLLAVL